MERINLIEPTAKLHASWLESTGEWGSVDQDGASVFFADKFGWELERPQDFTRWVQLLNNLAEPDFAPPAGFVSQSTRWVTRNDQYLGAVSLRHNLGNEFLTEIGGHIGYGIRPSARGQGLAKVALAGTLELARELGIERTLVTCNDSNLASAKTIESCGGVLEGLVPLERVARQFGGTQPVRRYWIQL